MDDFGKILEQWENDDKSHYVDKDEILSGYNVKKALTQYREKDLKKMKPQDKLDLHGYTAAEAEIELERFLKISKKRGLKKVLIVHGKGYHSAKGPVLIEKVNTFLRRCSFTGMTGTPDQSLGGSGAVWVIIK